MNLQPKTKTQLEIKAEQKQEFKFIGDLRKIPGLKLYEFNTESMEVGEAKVKKEVVIGIHKEVVHKSKIIYNPKCIYYQALNLKKAVRKANIIIKQKTGVENYFKLEKGIVLRREL